MQIGASIIVQVFYHHFLTLQTWLFSVWLKLPPLRVEQCPLTLSATADLIFIHLNLTTASLPASTLKV